MLMPVIESICGLLEAVFNHEVGSPYFNVMLGVCLVAWVVVARILMAMLASPRGILAATAVATGAYFAAQVTIGVIETGGEQIEQRDQRVKGALL